VTTSIASQRLGKYCYRNESRLRDNGENQLFNEVFSRLYAKNYLKWIAGRLQTVRGSPVQDQ
jgi:hypothetical protein